jgi:hypothetical protein
MSQVVFVLLDWTQTNQQLMELAERAGCYCSVVFIGDDAARPSENLLPAWAGTVRTVSPQEILSGQVKQL